jgi:ribonuclease P protein component
MLAKNNRIPRSLFGELLRSSHYVNSGGFSLRFSFADTYNRPQIGISVSKKVSKSAVTRNTVRRRVYSLVHTILPRMKAGAYLFIAKPGAVSLKGESLNAELHNMLLEAGAIV